MPTSLFNGLIAPLIPYAIRGVIWYQGESNASNAPKYDVLFRALRLVGRIGGQSL